MVGSVPSVGASAGSAVDFGNGAGAGMDATAFSSAMQSIGIQDQNGVLFGAFDANHDNSVSAQEFLTGLEHLLGMQQSDQSSSADNKPCSGQGSPSSEGASDAGKLGDLNGDGVVDWKDALIQLGKDLKSHNTGAIQSDLNQLAGQMGVSSDSSGGLDSFMASVGDLGSGGGLGFGGM